MKRCSTCKETKFFDMFSKCKSRKDGYHNQCKACFRAYLEANKEKIAETTKAYYEANKEKISEQNKAYREANKEKLAEYSKAYYEANKERLKAYYEANKEKILDRHKAYKEVNKERGAEQNKAYREANKDKISEQNKAYREANKERRAEQNKAYREANKDKTNEKASRHRARKRNAIPKFLRNCGVEKQRLRDTYKLSQLFSEATGIEHHVDHMWPLSKGGPHWSGNLQILTATENLSKNDKLCKTLKKNIKASLEIARKEYNNEDHSNGHRD